MDVLLITAIYLVCVNIAGFISMGVDKAKAKKKAWRIPEATLFIIALIGGSIGSIIGMRVFRHKTRHWYFVVGMPLILVIQISVIVALFYSPIQFGIM